MTTERVRRALHGTPAAEFDFEVGPTSAASDLACWLWAAYGHRRGHLPTGRIAETLGVSASTVRKWLKLAAKEQKFTRAPTSSLNGEGMRRIKQRAILRGKGTYLWPPVDEATLTRSQRSLAKARTALANYRDLGPGPRDEHLGRTREHLVVLTYYPGAHVFGISVTRNDKTEANLRRNGDLRQVIVVSNQWAGDLVKQLALEEIGEHRVVAPRALVPQAGRTEVWAQRAGEIVDLHQIAKKAGINAQEVRVR